MHFTNSKLCFDIFMVGHLKNILMEHDPNYLWNKRKHDHFDPYNVLLAIATNISVLIKTDSVIQGHIVFVLNLCRWSIKGGSY